jgi:polyhydroxyalkanoate synthesis repressor PhaR
MVLIRKYGNRRLYDTSDSRYVTLDELAQKIRSGSDLRIVDAQTGEDLTQATLTQLVLETGNAAKFLPVQLLTQMIRLSDDSLAEFFSRYVTSALDVYLQAKRGMAAIPGYNTISQIPMAATDALTRMWMGGAFGAPQPYPGQYGGYAPPPSYPMGPPPEPPPPADDDSMSPRSKRADSRSDADEAPARRPSKPAMEQAEDVAAMRRELDELKQALRDSLPKKRGPKKKS